MAKKWIFNLLLLFGALVIGFLMCEILVRIFMPRIGWRPAKEEKLVWAAPSYLKFDPLADERISHQPRILFLGDSYMAGSGLSKGSQRISEQFQQKMGDSVSVQTFAAGGWSIDQQYLAFLQKGKAWSPDLVVVAFCANNDLANILSNRQGATLQKHYFVVDSLETLHLYNGQGEPLEIKQFEGNYQTKQITRSYFISLIQYAIYQFRQNDQPTQPDSKNVDSRYTHPPDQPDQLEEIYQLQPRLSWSPQKNPNSFVSAYIHDDFEVNTYQWHLYTTLLKELSRECQQIDAQLMMMLLPVTLKIRDTRFIAGGSLDFTFQTPDGEFTYRAAEPRHRLKSICDSLNIDFFDPTAQFIEHIEENNLVDDCWPDQHDRHFSAVAHRILADQFYQYYQYHPLSGN